MKNAVLEICFTWELKEKSRSKITPRFFTVVLDPRGMPSKCRMEELEIEPPQPQMILFDITHSIFQKGPSFGSGLPVCEHFKQYL